MSPIYRHISCVEHCAFFFFNDTATTEIYTLSLHDALPILLRRARRDERRQAAGERERHAGRRDRKSTRLNSSHSSISYAVFCLKKKKNNTTSDLNLDTLPSTLRPLTYDMSPTAPLPVNLFH